MGEEAGRGGRSAVVTVVRILVVLFVVGVVVAIQIPRHVRDTNRANELMAVSRLRRYLAAQATFRRTDHYGRAARPVEVAAAGTGADAGEVISGKEFWTRAGAASLVYANPSDGRGFVDLYELVGQGDAPAPGEGEAGARSGLIDAEMARATGPETAARGYYFVDITHDAEGERYDYSADFGLCAVPAEHGETGRRTFVVDAAGTVYGRDNGGRAVTQYPDTSEGWEPVQE